MMHRDVGMAIINMDGEQISGCEVGARDSGRGDLTVGYGGLVIPLSS